MAIEDLPDELLEWCFQVADMRYLRALRLVNSRLLPLATKRLFCHVEVLPTDASAQKARLILDDSKLNPLVTKITLNTSPSPVPNPLSYDCEGQAELPELYESVLGDVGRYQNLRSVELSYSDECAAAGAEVVGLEKEVWETIEYRSTILKMLMEGLNDEDHPATGVKSLTIKNLQDIVDRSVANSEDFRAVLSRLESLSLQIVTEYDDAAPENTIYIEEPYKFFGDDLRQYWLEPVRVNLTHLKLYATQTFWGYLPYCNLPGLHFPKLKSLSLGNMTFTHDWQMDWILSHGSTLESLTLDDCPIVHAANLAMETKADRYPKLEPCRPATEDYSDQSFWTYETRWHHHLQRLKDGLPHLKHFGFGHGPWDQGRAFDEAASLPAMLYPQRYCIFDQGTGPSAWIEPGREYRLSEDGKTETVECGYDCCWEEHPFYPDCDEQDQKALDELMSAVRSRT